MWLSCGGRELLYSGYNTVRNLQFAGQLYGALVWANPWTHFDHASITGVSNGATFSLFSFFSRVTKGSYGASLSADSGGAFVGDYWGLAMIAEGCHVEGAYATGGNAALVGNGVFVNPYVDMQGYYAFCRGRR